MDVIFKTVNLRKDFKLRKRISRFGRRRLVSAVDDLSFDVKSGEIFGIVGESGCGKTTLARLIMQLEKPTNGQILYKGIDMALLNHKQMKNMRRHVQMIFQDPYSSLNPVKSIFYIMAEPLWIHRVFNDRDELKKKVCETLEAVGLQFSDEMLRKRPDELSGGERQRVGIASALILDPEFIVADEPVSMLDASVRAEIVKLLLRLKGLRNLTYIFITHELDVAYAICDRVAVMYSGKIVELSNTEEIIKNPLHPYTRLLIHAIPPLRPDKSWGNSVAEGEVAYYIEQPSGCKFQARCKSAQSICKQEEPTLIEAVSGHYVSCHNSFSSANLNT